MKDGKLCYAVLGLGIGMAHAEAAAASENCILYAACDKDEERLARFSELYPDAVTYTDFEDLLKDDKVDIVSVCLPSAMHADYAVRLMEASKHVLVEKPIDITPERAMLIERARLRTGMTCGVVHQNRFNLNMYPIKRAVESGLLGRIYLGTFAVKWFREQSYYDRGGWRGTWEMDGGGSLMNQAVHTVDLMLWLMGDIKSISSKGGIVGHKIDTEDLTASLIEFESGALATFVSTTCAYPGLSTEIMIYGTGGSIEADAARIKRFELSLSEDTADEDITGLFEELVKGDSASRLPASLDEIGGFDGEELSDLMRECFSKGNRHASELFPNRLYGHRFVVEDMVLAVKEGRDPSVMPLDAIKAVEAVRRIYSAAGLV